MSGYDVGDRVRLTADFTDLDEQPVDPDTVTCMVRDPSAAETAYTYAGGQVVRTDPGAYRLEVDLDLPGVWWIRWQSSGAGRAAEETSLLVRASQFTGGA